MCTSNRQEHLCDCRFTRLRLSHNHAKLNSRANRESASDGVLKEYQRQVKGRYQ